MLCYRCGTDNEEGEAVCVGCGLALEEASGSVGADSAELTDPGQDEAGSGEAAELPFGIGDRVAERYEVREIMGEGPHGTVLKVFDEEIEVDVALKLLDPRISESDSQREAVLGALRKAQQLSHQNIVRIFDADVVEGRIYYTTQALEGLTLRRILQNRYEKRQVFTLLEVEPIVSQITQALHYAHRVFPHGLLKPENVFVLPDMVKVMDFGLGPALGAPGIQAFALERGAGGELYLPPSVREGAEINEQADVYALGVILAEMLTGERFQGAGRFDVVGLNPALPPAVAEVFDRAVGRDADESYSSATELTADLESVIDTGKVRTRGGESGAVITSAPAPAPAPRAGHSDDAVTQVRSEGTQEISADMIVPDDDGDYVEPGEDLFGEGGGGLAEPILAEDFHDEVADIEELQEEHTSPVPMSGGASGAAAAGASGAMAVMPAPAGTVPVQQPDGSVVHVPLAAIAELQPKKGGGLVAALVILIVLLLGAVGAGGWLFLKWNEERGKPRPTEVVVADRDDGRGGRPARGDRDHEPDPVTAASAGGDDGVGGDRGPGGDGGAGSLSPGGDDGAGGDRVEPGGDDGKKAGGDDGKKAGGDDGKKAGDGGKKAGGDGVKKAGGDDGKKAGDDAKKAGGDDGEGAGDDGGGDDGKKAGGDGAEGSVATGPATGTKCPKGMRIITSKKGNYCIDIFEYPNKPKVAPKTGVDYSTAKELCEKAGRRLCTVREWTGACLGKGGAKFPYGKKYDPEICVTEDADGDDRRVMPSGSKKACRSAKGVYDMSGNVEEWAYGNVKLGGAGNKADDLTACTNKAKGGATSYTGFRCCDDAEK